VSDQGQEAWTTETMRAIVLDAPGPPDALTIRELAVPRPAAGWVLIEVKARAEPVRVAYPPRPRIRCDVPAGLGIEAGGVVAQCPGGEFPVGRQASTMMGDMGRTLDGGYAEYTCVPASHVIPFTSDLEWSILGWAVSSRVELSGLLLNRRIFDEPSSSLRCLTMGDNAEALTRAPRGSGAVLRVVGS
jgi:NADPH:quinone reductase